MKLGLAICHSELALRRALVLRCSRWLLQMANVGLATGQVAGLARTRLPRNIRLLQGLRVKALVPLDLLLYFAFKSFIEAVCPHVSPCWTISAVATCEPMAPVTYDRLQGLAEPIFTSDASGAGANDSLRRSRRTSWRPQA